MRPLFTLVKHEIRSLLLAPSTYVAAFLSLLMMSFLYLLTLYTLSSGDQEQQPATLFYSTFWVPALLIVPMLTMRSFAEERRLGTLEALMTTPIRPLEVVLAKFIATYFFYALIWTSSLSFPAISSWILKQPDMTARFLDSGSLYGGLSFVLLSGMLFISVGIFTSSLTRSQLVAGMLSFSIIFMLIVGVAAVQLLEVEVGQYGVLSEDVISYFQIFDHFEDFSRGMVDTRPFTYYLSGTALILGLSVIMVEAKS